MPNAQKDILNGIDNCLPTAELMVWKESIGIELNRRIDILQKVLFKNISPLFQLKRPPTESHKKYHLVPFDQVAGRVTLIDQ